MTPRTAAFWLAIFTASCQPHGPPPPVTGSPDQHRHENGSGISVEAEGLPPEAKSALANAMKRLLANAIQKAIQDGVEELKKKLKLADEVEQKLFDIGHQFDFGDPDKDDDTLCILLIRPGDPARRPETIEIILAGRLFVRFTRAFAEVERPIATTTRSRVTQGCVTQTDLFLNYGRDGKWTVARPAVKQENLRSGGQ